MKSPKAGRALLIALITVTCRAPANVFWISGSTYEVALVTTERYSKGPFTGPLRNHAQLRLRVDSIRGDSIYGTYEADFRGFGIVVGSAPTGSQPFSGELRADSVHLELSPNEYATDAGLVMTGGRTEAGIEGVWMTEAVPRVNGTFRLNRTER
jgi:hypothetical protein